MTDFGFGQPDGGVVQLAYKVADLEQAMADFGSRLPVGPWFVLGPFTPPHGVYRGAPCLFNITIGFAFAGHVQIELLQQHNDAPSTLSDRPFGFHHWGLGVRDFDAARAKQVALGHEIVFTDVLDDGGRIAYADPGSALPAMVELIEMTPGRDAMFTMIYQAAQRWDGSDPVRSLNPD